MAFTPEPEFPDFTQLLTSLNNSQISVKNPALYQTIKGLIGKIQGLKGLAQEDIDTINQNITDLSNTINNFTTGGTTILPPPIMPVFDGVDGDDAFPIPGPAGKDGLDGKTIPPFDNGCCDCDPLIPFGPFCICDAGAASEFSFTTTGNIDDLDFGNARLIRANNASLATIRGLKAGVAGQEVTIVSIGAGQVDFAHQNGSSSANNRLINFATSANTSLAAGSGAATFKYDGTTLRWRLVQHDQGAWIEQAFNAGDFTGSGGMTVTVAAADRINQGYMLNGRTLTVNFEFQNVTLATAAGTTIIQSPIPGGYIATRQSQQPCVIGDNATTAETGKCFVTAGGTSLNMRRAANVNWTLGADVAAWFGVLNLEVN